MKKIIVTLVIAFVCQIGFSQSVFDKFENQNDVTALVVTKSMFKLMSKIDLNSNDPDAKEYLQMVESLDNIKIFTTGNTQVAGDMKKTVDAYLKSSTTLSELMRATENGKNVRFYVKEGKDENFVDELFMFVEDVSDAENKAVIMSITGNIDLRQISKLTSDLKVPGSEKLKDAKKSKE